MSVLNVCILGGTGFVGRSIVDELVTHGHQVTVLTRRRERHRDMLVLPTLSLIEGDIHELGFLREQFQNKNAVINLTGILNSSGKNNFQRIHVELPGKVVDAMRQTGTKRLLHMSALNASTDGPSKYLRSKGEAEDLLHQHAKDYGYEVTSFRPSVIFGPLDSFTNRFADLIKITPLLLPLACPNARFQPVYVGDVARCFVRAIKDHDTFDQRYNLCGPKTYTLYELVGYIMSVMGVSRRIVRLSDWQSRLQAAILQWAPGRPFTLDNYNSMKVDSVCEGDFPAIFQLTPMALEMSLPTYLRKQPDRLDGLRRLARR